MNTKYTLTTHDVEGIYSSKTSYATDDETATANDSTIFFVNDGDDDFSVVIGVSNLPTNIYEVDSGDYVSLYENSSGTVILEAMIASGSADFYSSSSYAFVTGNYSKISTTVYSYPVVLEDGTVTTLTTKDDELSSDTIYSYYYDTNGYAVFEDKYLDNSNVVTYISGSVVGYADSWNDATVATVDGSTSWTYSAADIWDVQDTDDVFETTLSLENAFAFAYDNDTKEMIVAFVYDEQDTMTEDFDVTISSDGTIDGYYGNQYVSAVKDEDKDNSYTVYEDEDTGDYYVVASKITAEDYYWVTISEDGYESRTHYVQADAAPDDDVDVDVDYAVTLLSVEYDGTDYIFTFDTDLDAAIEAGDLYAVMRGTNVIDSVNGTYYKWTNGYTLVTSSLTENDMKIMIDEDTSILDFNVASTDFVSVVAVAVSGTTSYVTFTDYSSSDEVSLSGSDLGYTFNGFDVGLVLSDKDWDFLITTYVDDVAYISTVSATTTSGATA